MPAFFTLSYCTSRYITVLCLRDVWLTVRLHSYGIHAAYAAPCTAEHDSWLFRYVWTLLGRATGRELDSPSVVSSCALSSSSARACGVLVDTRLHSRRRRFPLARFTHQSTPSLSPAVEATIPVFWKWLHYANIVRYPLFFFIQNELATLQLSCPNNVGAVPIPQFSSPTPPACQLPGALSNEACFK